ncbi:MULTISPECIES: prepilin peptidase [unclassified Brevundimonas]|uniref:prepilin peptidase n=1 Tax=unclassified Brevundimonas TaxID=2622653 RepID=UPI0025B9EFE9|nr:MULTISPECIES: A24 family peptidase [unclassified Brevundimonas]
MDHAMIVGAALALCGLAAGYVMVPLALAFTEPRPALPHHRRLGLPLAAAIIGGGVALWGMWQDHSLLTVLFTALLGWQLLLIGFVDAENHWLPDMLTFPLGVTGIAASVLLPYPFGHGWMAAIVSGVVAFCLLWLLSFVYRKLRGQSGLGGGDPILFGMGAAWVGLADLMPVLLLSSVFAALAALALKLRGQQLGRHSQLPFGTYMAAAFAVMWLIG